MKRNKNSICYEYCLRDICTVIIYVMNEDFTYEDAHTFIDKKARYFDQFGLIRVHWQK